MRNGINRPKTPVFALAITCCTRAVSWTDIGTDWIDGCGRLWSYDKPRLYRRLRLSERLRVELRAGARILGSGDGARAIFAVASGTLATYVATWQLDLYGVPRDVLRMLPILVSLPWWIAVRRRHLRAVLRFRETAHRHPDDDM